MDDKRRSEIAILIIAAVIKEEVQEIGSVQEHDVEETAANIAALTKIDPDEAQVFVRSFLEPEADTDSKQKPYVLGVMNVRF